MTDPDVVQERLQSLADANFPITWHLATPPHSARGLSVPTEEMPAFFRGDREGLCHESKTSVSRWQSEGRIMPTTIEPGQIVAVRLQDSDNPPQIQKFMGFMICSNNDSRISTVGDVKYRTLRDAFAAVGASDIGGFEERLKANKQTAFLCTLDILEAREGSDDVRVMIYNPVSYTHLTLPTTPYV